MRDPQAGELLRQAAQRNAELAEPDPSRLEVTPREARSGCGREWLYTSNFSMTVPTGTTCRLNWSSDS